jgi:hypothetical protein
MMGASEIGDDPIDDLVWTRTGCLLVVATGDGPQIWNPLHLERGFVRPEHRPHDLYDRSSVDPAGRYLGVVASSYSAPFHLVIAGVLGFGEETPKDLLLVERPWTNLKIQRITWAEARPAVFLEQSRLSGLLNPCGREEHALVCVDPVRGVDHLELDPLRALTGLSPSPDGRLALFETNPAPPALRRRHAVRHRRPGASHVLLRRQLQRGAARPPRVPPGPGRPPRAHRPRGGGDVRGPRAGSRGALCARRTPAAGRTGEVTHGHPVRRDA